MRYFIRLLLIPGLIGWLFGGCSEKLEPKPATYSQLLTGTDKKSWKMVSLQIIDDGNASSVIPISQSGINPCVTDDLFTFYANDERRFEVSEGASKCNSSDPDVYLTDTWTLVNANATLQFAVPIVTETVLPYTIKNLTSNALTVEIYLEKITTDNLNASYRFTFNSVPTK